MCNIGLLFTVTVTSNASRHFKSPLAMGEMPFKIKRASSVSISVVIDTGVNSNNIGVIEGDIYRRLFREINCAILFKY